MGIDLTFVLHEGYKSPQIDFIAELGRDMVYPNLGSYTRLQYQYKQKVMLSENNLF